MKATILAAIGVLVTAFAAQAQLIGNPTFTVPGVVNFGSLGTVITCTNTNAATTAAVTVEIYNNTGAMVATGTAPALGPQQSALFGTRSPIALAVDTDFGLASSGGLSKGSAKIFSTSKNVMCSALILDLVNGPPTSMASLVVVAGKKQK